MKREFNIRIFFILLFLSFLGITFYASTSNALTTVNRNDVECTGNGGTISRPGTTDCEFTPDTQKITFYRLDLCTAAPTAPTTSAVADRSNCSTFFRNDDGSETTVVKNVGTQIGSASNYSTVPYGTYTHGYVTMGSIFKFKTSVTFDGNVTEIDASNSSTTCVTKVSTEGIIYGWHDNLNTYAKGNADCTGTATAAEISIGVNTMTMDGSNNCYHAVTFAGTNSNIDAYLVTSDGTLHDNVGAGGNEGRVDNGSAGCTGSADHDITRIEGVMPLSLTITPETTGLQIRYNNTRGIKLDMSSTSNRIYKFDSAFFDFELIAK
jgi:hypothetical protein